VSASQAAVNWLPSRLNHTIDADAAAPRGVSVRFLARCFGYLKRLKDRMILDDEPFMERSRVSRPALVALCAGALLLTACSSSNSATHSAAGKLAPASPAQSASNADGLTAYVTNAEDNGKTPGVGTIIPINLKDNKPGLPIQLGQGAGTNDMMVTADGKTAYVTNEDTDTVTSVDLLTGKLGNPIKVGSEPVAIAFVPKSHEQWAWTSNIGDKTVSTVNLVTGKIGQTIALPEVGANTVAFTPDGQICYVANWGTTASPGNTVTPIAVTGGGSSGRLLPSIKVGLHPNWIAVTGDGRTAFVANKGSSSITPIEVASNAAGAAIQVPGPPIEMQISPDGRTAYVAIAGSAPEVDKVVPFDLTTSPATAGTAIKLPAKTQPHWIDFTPDGKTAYVVGNGNSTVTAIDVATGTAASPIKVTADPDSDLLDISIVPTRS
jgi:DNA-binding beta-propeller fold protein YncE